jgi:REP element-mobilizing transposase RayT
MLIQPYRLDELRFAWCYRVYLRWRTYRVRRYPALAELDKAVLDGIGGRFDMGVLEDRADETDVLLLLSLKPSEPVSVCASKWKGQISKWLRGRLGIEAPASLLSRGYFSCTAGHSTPEAVDAYLNKQGEHHGYSERARPPLGVRQFPIAAADEERLRPKHASTLLRHHVVLATPFRKGVFGRSAGEAVADHWRRSLSEARATLIKAWFLPDHVHAAIQVHPSVAPAELIARMMNEAQELMFRQFSDSVIHAGVERLWQSSAYVGSYGDLASPQVSKYIRNWKAEATQE